MASNFGETAVKTVVVDRQRLAQTLAANLETHKREFAEALKGYFEKKAELMRKVAETSAAAVPLNDAQDPNDDARVEANKKVHEAYGTFSSLSRPSDHSKDYEQALMLAEWETRDTVELSINDFEAYVRDNWNWRSSFKMLHDSYSKS